MGDAVSVKWQGLPRRAVRDATRESVPWPWAALLVSHCCFALARPTWKLEKDPCSLYLCSTPGLEQNRARCQVVWGGHGGLSRFVVFLVGHPYHPCWYCGTLKNPWLKNTRGYPVQSSWKCRFLSHSTFRVVKYIQLCRTKSYSKEYFVLLWLYMGKLLHIDVCLPVVSSAC